MKKSKLIDSISTQEFTFKMQKIGSEIALRQFGILVTPERLKVEVVGDAVVDKIRLLFAMATQDDEFFKHPTEQNCRGLWWEYFKQRWFPNSVLGRWLLKKFPVRVQEIGVVHKFPEIDAPESVLGREFVTLRVLDAWDLQDKLEKEANEMPLV